MAIKYSATNLFKYEISDFIKTTMFPETANTYVAIGRPIRWGADSNETTDEIEDVFISTNYVNEAHRNTMAMKRIKAADIALVVPRLDWVINTIYDKYNDHIELPSHEKKTQIAVVTANATMNLSGTVNVTGSNIYGTSTFFVGNVSAGDIVTVNAQNKVVTSVPNNTYLSVSSNFTYAGNGNVLSLNVSSQSVRNSTGFFSGNVDLGDIVLIGNERKQVVDRLSDYTLRVNTKFDYAYSDNTTIVVLENKYPLFANNFYVRNSRDQIFKCLDNFNGASSTVEPTIDIDGQLPEDPHIETGDGYKWKYLYTIPYGLKQKFFTKQWMPVVSDRAVTEASVDGRIDIVDILSGGSGYYQEGILDGTISSYDILTVTGDGSGANLTAQVVSGVITDVNILDGGSGYTKATVTASDPEQISGGTEASFDVVIGPQGGHGSNPAKELGCFSFMVSVELNSTENGKIPVTGASSGDFDFRQISVIRDPLLANGSFATDETYRTTTKFSLSDPGSGSNFLNDETVFIGVTEATATFTGTVAHWDTNYNELFVIDLDGTYSTSVGQEITGATSGAKAAIVAIEESELLTHSGDTLYIENRLPIIRNTDQTEQIRLVYSF
jgi:hypothetical protein